MGAVTYPDPQVEEYINQRFVPVQFNIIDQPGIMKELHAAWTPTLIVQDANGTEHRRSEGYLDPPRFLAEMSLARVKDAIDRQAFDEALSRAQEALELCKGDDLREPEARYWASVAEYKSTNDVNRLTAGWNELLDRFPGSDWARRAEFIRG